MLLDTIQTELAQLLQPAHERGLFERLWGIRQEPAELQAEALATLLRELAPAGGEQRAARGRTLLPYFEAACRELQTNLQTLRDLHLTRTHPPFAHVTWLWKVSQVLEGLRRDGWLDVAPLARSPKRERQAPPPVSWLLRLPLDPLVPPLRTGVRLQGLALAPLLDMASRETQQLGRRRRLLEAARRLLLETSASVPQPPADVQARSLAIANQIRQLNEWQAAGVDPEVDVAHQLTSAVRRRDAASATRLLGALDALTRASTSPPELCQRVFEARRAAGQHFERFSKPPSLQQLGRDTFGATAAAAIQRGSARAVAELDAAPSAEGDLVRAGSAVDGSFELGRSVAAVRVLEVQRRMAEVDFPTQSMLLAPARKVADLPNSLIHDPRLLLHDLATRALLARRYLAERKRRRLTAPRYSEARYYLLDGSASMAGRRGRMRDAILIAELSSMIRHLEEGTAHARPVVYFRYFSKAPEPLVKAHSIEDACAAIEAVLMRKSRGETELEGALLTCFQELRAACDGDDSLKRAQLVLVTDGVAKLDLERVWAARQHTLAVPVQVSVIALGSENPALKELAAAQRARGEQVFYHFLSDETLYRMSRGVRVQSSVPQAASIPVSPSPAPSSVPREPAARSPLELAPSLEPAPEPHEAEGEIWRELGQLVDELELLREPPDLDGIAQAEQLGAAYEDLGMSLSDPGLEAERARYEAKRRDERALTVRFDRWFPKLPPQAVPIAGDATEPELLDVIEVALLSVADLVVYLGGSPLQRRVDAIELLERLLLEAGVTPWEYCHALPHASPAIRAAIEQLRSLVPSRAEA